MTFVGRLGDRLLARLVPASRARAAQACALRNFWWYKCEFTYLKKCYRCSCTPIGHCD
ncbi:hypothetical protein [Phytomonospora endophytica]|uniref:Uncharacterized protein n=1 Tax=Phytomonospora endophytica TaxID=714109 RepID=A0A841G6A2_9ACTN|nr:hypothetical protein [Phytomonospora endophytica]MBB6039600.1 hypothetical protein [Phytomonospora endophytica]GIG65682.1 hypothetical protein Pen01_19770 [Phytomonospora endophytica]